MARRRRLYERPLARTIPRTPRSISPKADRSSTPGPAACPLCGARAGQYRRDITTGRLVCIECAITSAGPC